MRLIKPAIGSTLGTCQ